MNRRVQTTPLVESVVARVQQHLSSWGPRDRRVTFSEALDWVMRDINWCEKDKPAYGRYSPVLAGILRAAIAEVESAAQPTKGDEQ